MNVGLIQVFAKTLVEGMDLPAAVHALKYLNGEFAKALVEKVLLEVSEPGFDPEQEFWDALSDYGTAVGGNPAKLDETPEAWAATLRLHKLCLKQKEEEAVVKKEESKEEK